MGPPHGDSYHLVIDYVKEYRTSKEISIILIFLLSKALYFENYKSDGKIETIIGINAKFYIEWYQKVY
jgi:hypothetical protein